MEWTPECQDSFEKMKAIMAKETLVTFPNFTKEFKIHTDASKLQLGACISQGGKPVAFYPRKLQPAQTHYTTIQKASYFRWWKHCSEIYCWAKRLKYIQIRKFLLIKTLTQLEK
jgi:hypothetical protein